MFQARGETGTSSPPTGYTEFADTAGNFANTVYNVTTPPASSATIPANTWNSNLDTVRAAVAWEMAPNVASDGLAFTVNAVEVT